MEPGIVERLKIGDRDAFRWLFEHYHETVFSTAWHILRNEADAEEILQEAFLRAFRAIGSFDPDRGTLEGWLRTIVSREALKRAQRRRPHVALEIEPTGPDKPIEHDLHHALSGLTVRQRALIVLRFTHGLALAEIARELDMPLGSVKSGLNLALRKLRARMGQRLQPPFEPEVP